MFKFSKNPFILKKKILVFVVLVVLFCASGVAYAQGGDGYDLLAPLPGFTFFSTEDACPLGRYLGIIFSIFIGIVAVLAMLMIVIGGVEYMTSSSVSGKGEGKSRILNAIIGLLIALASWLILDTINPKLLDICLSNLPEAYFEINPNSLYDKEGSDYSSRCVTLASGPCSVSNLTQYFGNKAESMSKICNVESGGQNIPSGTDVCEDGNVFSFGLLQINLLSNGSIINHNGTTCANLFNTSKGPTRIPGSNPPRYYCKLKPGQDILNKYNACKNILLSTSGNISAAVILFQQGKSAFGDSLFAWRADKKVCASAFY